MQQSFPKTLLDVNIGIHGPFGNVTSTFTTAEAYRLKILILKLTSNIKMSPSTTETTLRPGRWERFATILCTRDLPILKFLAISRTKPLGVLSIVFNVFHDIADQYGV